MNFIRPSRRRLAVSLLAVIAVLTLAWQAATRLNWNPRHRAGFRLILLNG